MKISETKLTQLVSDMKTDPALLKEFQDSPLDVLNTRAAADAKSSDVWIYRIVVFALSLTILIIVFSVFANLKAVDDAKNALTLITALGSAAIGALAGLLAPSPIQNSNSN